MTLRNLRLRAELNQEEVAKKMNVDQATVSNWELGKHGIPRKHHTKLAKLYGCTVEQLLAADTGAVPAEKEAHDA